MNDIDKMPSKCRDCPYWELAKFPWCCGDCKERMKKPVGDFVSRQWLIDEYYRRHEGPPGGALKMIEEAPAADVVSVVRCRDCKFASMTYDGECKYCACFGSKDEYGELDPELYLPDDFFCAFGERKEDS